MCGGVIMLDATQRPSEQTADGSGVHRSAQESPADPAATFLDPSEIDALLDRTEAIAQALGDTAGESDAGEADVHPAAPIPRGEVESLASLDERLAREAKASHALPDAATNPHADPVTEAGLSEERGHTPASTAPATIDLDLSGFTKPAPPRRSDTAEPAPSRQQAAADASHKEHVPSPGPAEHPATTGTESDGGPGRAAPAWRVLTGRVDRVLRRGLGVLALPVRGLGDGARRWVDLTVLTLAAWAGLSWVAVLILVK